MRFNSIQFLIFFPIVTLLYFALPQALSPSPDRRGAERLAEGRFRMCDLTLAPSTRLRTGLSLVRRGDLRGEESELASAPSPYQGEGRGEVVGTVVASPLSDNPKVRV